MAWSGSDPDYTPAAFTPPWIEDDFSNLWRNKVLASLDTLFTANNALGIIVLERVY